MARCLLGALAVVIAALGALAPAAPAATQRPIVYAIVIDALDGDAIDQGKAPFISSLLAGDGAAASYYRESRSIVTADTNPNHVAMATGAYAERSGIPSNGFAIYAPLENEDSCRPVGREDPRAPPTPASGENANCVLAQTVFEAVKRQRNPDGLLTAAIFGKQKLGRIFSGRNFDGRNRDVDHLWAPCGSEPEDDDYCGEVPQNPVGDSLTDAITMDEVIRTIRDGTRHEHRRPDFTFVNLHQVDRAGHVFGMGSSYDEAIALADDEIARLVGELRSRGEWERTVLVLLSDHSVDTIVRRVDLASLFADAGIPERDVRIVHPLGVSVAHVYLADRESPDRFALLQRMRAAALSSPDVAEALYRESNPMDGGVLRTVGFAHPDWHASHARSGDLLVLPAPGASFSDATLETPFDVLPGAHGASQTRDNFFAVVGGGPFVRQVTLDGQVGPLFDDTSLNSMQAENVDVASTVMGLFGLFAPRENQARFLSEAFDLAALPGGGAPTLRPRLRVRRLPSRPCRRTVRYRLRLSPRGGLYDLAVSGRRRRGRSRRRQLLEDSPRTTYTYRARRGRRYQFRARMLAASGAPSAKARRTVRAPGCRR
jgi:hypothetical protein